jgi:hypothetical protein
MHPHTSCRRMRIDQQINDPVEHPLDYGARCRLSERVREINGRTLGIAVEHFAEKRFLVTKCGVKTRTIDTHRICEIGKRPAKVTLPPKNLHRAVQRILCVESAGTSEYRCQRFQEPETLAL